MIHYIPFLNDRTLILNMNKLIWELNLEKFRTFP